MTTLPLAKALEILDGCTAVQVDQNSLVYPNLYEEGEDEYDQGYFLLLSTPYADEKFLSKQNENIQVDEFGQLILINERGEQTQVLPLAPRPKLDSVREQIQEDLRTRLEGVDQNILDTACQIVVENFQKL